MNVLSRACMFSLPENSEMAFPEHITWPSYGHVASAYSYGLAFPYHDVGLSFTIRTAYR